MTKHYILATLSSIVIVAAIVIAMFLLMLPQVENLKSEVITKYLNIDSAEFQFVETKHFVTEILSKKYSITQDDINTFEKNDQYNPGNTDPFTPKNEVQDATNNSNEQTAQNNNNNANNSGKPITGTKK